MNFSVCTRVCKLNRLRLNYSPICNYSNRIYYAHKRCDPKMWWYLSFWAHNYNKLDRISQQRQMAMVSIYMQTCVCTHKKILWKKSFGKNPLFLEQFWLLLRVWTNKSSVKNFIFNPLLNFLSSAHIFKRHHCFYPEHFFMSTLCDSYRKFANKWCICDMFCTSQLPN